MYRGDGMRSAREADARENLASLTQRLESLHATIVSSEARWRTRGAGFREVRRSSPTAVSRRRSPPPPLATTLPWPEQRYMLLSPSLDLL